MGRSSQTARVGQIEDALAYVLLYAPDFPVEDETSVEAEFDTLLEKVRGLWAEIQDADRRKWLDMLGRELVEARGAFLGGDPEGGRHLVESAQERLRAWSSKRRRQANFIANSDGGIERR